MVWGQAASRGIEDLVRRIAENDPKLNSLTIMRQRRLNHDDVASLVRALAANTHLTELYASSHPMAPHTARLVGELLAGGSCRLRSLCVGDGGLGDEGVAELAKGVAGSTSLEHLDVSNKGFGVPGAEALGRALSAAPALTALDAGGNPRLGDDGVRALCSGPQPWPRLTHLDLSGCDVTAAGLRALAAAAAGGGGVGSSRLAVVRLDGNPLGTEGGGAAWELVRACPALKELSLRGTQLGDEGGYAMGAAMQEGQGAAEGGHQGGDGGEGGGSCLLWLDLSDCGLGSRTADALCGALRGRGGTRLGALVLSGNPGLGDAEAAALGAALGGRGQAQEQRPEGLGEQGEGAGLPALTHLDLQATKAGARAVEALSRAPRLAYLSLTGCPLGAQGGAALADSLLRVPHTAAVGDGDGGVSGGSAGGGDAGCTWPALRELCVSGAGVGLEEAKRVFDALAAGGAPQLQSLECGANPAAQDDSFPGLMEDLRASRPGLAVYWRSGDDPEGGPLAA